MAFMGSLLPMMAMGDQPTNVTLNTTAIQQFNDKGELVTGQDSMNQFYNQNVGIVQILTKIAWGTLMPSSTLIAYGMDSGLALTIDLILKMLICFDLITFWKGIPW
jgi:hypothetical protein